MLDSCCTYHIVNDKTMFDEGTFHKTEASIVIGNSEILQASGSGTCTRITNEGKKIVMNEVQWIPSCPHNLLAEGRFDRGRATILSEGGVRVIRMNSEVVIILRLSSIPIWPFWKFHASHALRVPPQKQLLEFS